MKSSLRPLVLVMLAGGWVSMSMAQPTQPVPPAQPVQLPGERAPTGGAIVMDAAAQEGPLLTGHTQLTFRKDFLKAGEAYFSPDLRWVIFQAVATPKDPAAVSGLAGAPYAMYVAKLVWDEKRTTITGLEEPILVSPEGSANTCGWFHPTDPGRIIFGSTMVPPSNQQKPGFQVGTNRYIWSFPKEMEVVTKEVGPVFLDHFTAEGTKSDAQGGPRLIDPPNLPDQELKVLFAREGYDAECSFSPLDGRFILYAHVDENKNPVKPDADLWVYDTQTGEQRALVTANGYDGGPFWSPDQNRICYRSDRKGDDLLQVYVADVEWKDDVPVGIRNETAITANEHVNWCPFWHPSGQFMVYATSEISHKNYEVFAVEAAAGKTAAEQRKRRVTFAEGADVLPAFSKDGRWMMWTSQRGAKEAGEEKASSQLWIARWHAREADEVFGGSAVPPGP